MIGQTLGHYRIDAQLGAGGMGVVYRAYDNQLQRTVAIKLVGERLSGEPTARERFLREARTASTLNHPHICTIHEVGEANGQVYIVMEHVEGKPLGDMVPAGGLPPETVIRYGIQIAEALAHAHEHAIVHRDLKTANVVVTSEGRAKVLDFGLAKRVLGEVSGNLWEEVTESDTSLTDAAVVGTLHYLAPETLQGGPADARTDLWALGVILYELASGSLPFQGRTRYEVSAKILRESPPPLPPRVPPGLGAIIQHCLAKEPSQRYQRAGEVRAALEAVQSGSVESAPAPARREFPRRTTWLAIGGLVLLAAVGSFRWFGQRDRGIQSIAVLPFANVGANPDQEYLSDGITENLIGSLSRLPNLKVIAFGSVLHYKGSPPDVQAVVRDLGVGAAVIGRVTQRGDSLSVMAELIDARDRSRLWGNQYDVKATELLAVQEEISRQISDQLRGRSRQEDKTRLAKRYTNDSEAYELYLKGRYYWQKFTFDDYQKALEFFRKAIQKDSEFAPAYAGVALVYASMTWEGMVPPQEGYAQIETAVNRALSLDDTVAVAHFLLGHTLRFGRDWNWRAAESELQRAIALDPQDAVVRRFYSQTLRALGRFDEAIAEMKRAKEVDPLGVETNKGLAYTYYWARRYDEAIEQCKKTLEIDPNYGPVHELLAEVYARKGMYKEAIAKRQQVFLLAGYKEDAEALAQDFEALGYEEVMRRLDQSTLDSLKESAKNGYVSPFSFAACYAKLGERDEAFAWLDKAAAERSPWVTLIKADPDFDGLRSDPRFAQLLKRIGLPL